MAFVIVIASYVAAGWSVAFNRAFEANQLFLLVIQSISFSVVLGTGVITIWTGYQREGTSILDLIIGLLVWGSIILWLDRKSNQWIRFSTDQPLLRFRERILDLSRNVNSTEVLISNLEKLTQIHFRCESATVIMEDRDCPTRVLSKLFNLEISSRYLSEVNWITPEALENRIQSSEYRALKQSLISNNLGLIIAVPRGSRAPSLLLALGNKHNQWPYTYPEIERLQNIAELMDNILTHSRLTAQAALQARIEYLAMMSRGLAHDIKNLITPVGSFLLHTDGRHPPGSPEAEVHAAAQRSVRVMNDYVREAMFFSEQHAPNFKSTRLGDVLRAVGEVTLARAQGRGVEVCTTCNRLAPIQGDTILLERMLANFVNNAIDASSAGQKVSLSVENSSRAGWVRIQVLDDGHGIASENLGRVFEPYFTTKEFGREVRGFGLGLTICQKIAHLHRGSIDLRSELGRGTLVTVELPAIQPGTKFDGD